MPKIITQASTDQRSLLTFTALDGSAEVAELLSAVQQLALARSMEEIEQIVPRAARRLTGADGATLALREGDRCLHVAEAAISPLWKGQSFPIDACADGWAIRNRQPIAITEVGADERAAGDHFGPTFVRSLAIVPIRPLEPLGTIGSYWAKPHEASERELRLLQALSDSTAVALENVRRHTELEDAYGDTLGRLALAAEYRDDATFKHTERVAHLAAVIARRLGLDADFVARLRQAAPLHDIGKLAVSETILLKQELLSSSEIIRMRAHAACGAELLAGSPSKVLQMAEEIALTHHEWWNGTGYPGGLRGDGIPLSGRIVGLADVFDALIHARPYRQALSLNEALREIDHLSGRQFDPMVVAAFFNLDEVDLALEPSTIVEPAPAGAHAASPDQRLSGSRA
ncbi:MAG: HD domain-containing protein [Acidobacteriota bacterium]|nr:HD domain-containing protein [Acidobacteriota bacterium]